MSWKELWLRGNRENSECFEQVLLDQGALSITVTDAADQPILEPAPGETPLWSQLIVTALFGGDVDLGGVADRVLAATGTSVLDWGQRHFEDEDWTRTWLADFKPMQFGGRLWVCAHHHPAPDSGTIVRLDPGLAFGTGTHPTTAMCLHWLAEQNLSGLRVIDYGCGSGILAIACALLGADSVVATDIDPQALESTQSNAAANKVSDKVHTLEPEAVSGTTDLLVANILSGPLIELAPRLIKLATPGGRIVVTGILDEQSIAVQSAYLNAGARLVSSSCHDQWNLHVFAVS